MSVILFVRESNAIEGIHRDPTQEEVIAHSNFLVLPHVGLTELRTLQEVIAPGKPLRTKVGMNVRVGSHVAPPGGPSIIGKLGTILLEADQSPDPWKIHCDYETLHPFMDGNGRTGRALWAWQMLHLGHDPFAIPFLHRFYYQTLENSRP